MCHLRNFADEAGDKLKKVKVRSQCSQQQLLGTVSPKHHVIIVIKIFDQGTHGRLEFPQSLKRTQRFVTAEAAEMMVGVGMGVSSLLLNFVLRSFMRLLQSWIS